MIWIEVRNQLLTHLELNSKNLFRASEAFNPTNYLGLNGSGGMFQKKSVHIGMGITSNQQAITFNKRCGLESKTIVIESILSGKDKRTTVMLRNIPLKYTINNLVDELNILFLGKYDFVNMPINSEVS